MSTTTNETIVTSAYTNKFDISGLPAKWHLHLVSELPDVVEMLIRLVSTA